MTPEEFSNNFDTLINAYAATFDTGYSNSPVDFSVDEYEKSMFLTMAQQDFVRQYYKGGNAQDSFDASEEVRRSLDALVLSNVATPDMEYSDDAHINPGNYNYTFIKRPDNLWYIIYEQGTYGNTDDNCMTGKSVSVVPVTYDYLWKQVSNPFRGPTKDRILRVDLENGYLELVSKYPIASYLMRYLKKPRPIITQKLPNGLTIEGESEEHGCELNQQTHDIILRLAVTAAVTSKKLNKLQKESTK